MSLDNAFQRLCENLTSSGWRRVSGSACGPMVGLLNANEVHLTLKSTGFDDEVEVHRISAGAPGKGAGTRALLSVLDGADREGIDLRLRPVPFRGLCSEPDLRRWYARMGFGVQDDGWMTRYAEPFDDPTP